MNPNASFGERRRAVRPYRPWSGVSPCGRCSALRTSRIFERFRTDRLS